MNFLENTRKKILSNKKSSKIIQNLAKTGSFLVYLLIFLIGIVTFILTKKNYPETLMEIKQNLLFAKQIPENLEKLFNFSFFIAIHTDILVMFTLLIIIILRYLSYEDKLESNIALNSINAITVFTFFMGEFYYLGFFKTLFITAFITILYITLLYIMGFIGEKEISLLKKELEEKNTPKKG